MFNLYYIDAIEYAVHMHMKFHDVLDMKPSKIARLVNNPYFEVLKEVAWADEFSRGETFSHYNEFDSKITKINQIKEKWENRDKQCTMKIVDGTRIMNLLNLESGPQIGKIKKEIENYVIDNELSPTPDLIDELIIKFGG